MSPIIPDLSSHKQCRNFISILTEHLCFSEHSSLILSNVERHSSYFCRKQVGKKTDSEHPLHQPARSSLPQQTARNQLKKTPILTTPQRETQGTKGFGEKSMQYSLDKASYIGIALALINAASSSKALS